MTIGIGETAGLIAVIVTGVKVIDKLADALISKYNQKNGRSQSPSQPLWYAAKSMEQAAQQISRLCELQRETRDEMRDGFKTLAGRMDNFTHREKD